MNNNNKPAFPNLNSDGYATSFEILENKEQAGAIGLTKREYFAGLAMQGLLSCNATYGGATNDYKALAKDSLAFADALLKQLES